MIVRLTLPEPPSANRLWRKSGAGHLYKDKTVLAFREAVYTACLKAKVTRPKFAPADPLKVTLTWYRARKSGDLDNRAKASLDALRGLAFVDDNQVCELHLFRVDGQRPARIEVTIERAA